MAAYSRRLFVGAIAAGRAQKQLITCPAGRVYVVRFVAAWALGQSGLYLYLHPASDPVIYTVAQYANQTTEGITRDVRFVLEAGDVMLGACNPNAFHVGLFGYDLSA